MLAAADLAPQHPHNGGVHDDPAGRLGELPDPNASTEAEADTAAQASVELRIEHVGDVLEVQLGG